AANYEKILKNLQERDQRDRTRTSAPLTQTKDAILLDTDNRNIDEAVAFVLSEHKKSLS
ncbi:MAG: (d)CMP kinase, partial [Methylophilaceae bacterium]